MNATATAQGGQARDVVMAVGFLAILTAMILPLPTFLMDLGLSLSICLSLVTFLVAIYLKDPLELSVFPSLVLVTTLMRLSLNVASTRLILLHGAEGPEAAGKVIKSFGHFNHPRKAPPPWRASTNSTASFMAMPAIRGNRVSGAPDTGRRSSRLWYNPPGGDTHGRW